MQYVTQAATFPENPVVRAQAIETLQEIQGEQAASWFRQALSDEHPGVRFAACMAIGTIRHKPSEALVRLRLADPDASVRVAAMYALRRMGDQSFVREWAEIITSHPDVPVRRNAVLALGRLGEQGAAGLLRRVRREDKDESVQLQALEGMALLGDRHAVADLIFYANSNVGALQVFALATLGRIGDPRCIPTLEYCFKNAPYLESRLAAARALGMMSRADGFQLALQSLDWNRPDPKLPEDQPENQIMRVRTQAALALGAIGKPEALTPLRGRMEQDADPRCQLAAATAILQILQRQETAPIGPPLEPMAPIRSAKR